MRAYEFIIEASIWTKPERYEYGHKVRIGIGSKKGKNLLQIIKNEIPNFDPKEDLEYVASAPAGTITIQFGRGDDVGSFKQSNGEYLNIKGSGSVWEKAFTHAPGQKGSTAENKGDLSEPLLSSAVVAKLIKRGQENIEDVTEDDIKKILNQALESKGKNFVVQDKNSKIADTISFTVALRAPTLEFMKSSNFWNSYGGLVPSAVHYANSGQIDRYADYFFKNGKVDNISIESDGMSDQKSRKTDIKAYANGKLLKNLNISLKAGSPHIGQVGGGSLKNLEGTKGSLTNAKKLFEPFGVSISKPENITSKSKFWVSVYRQAEEQIKKELSGNDAKKEAGIVFRLADWLTSHGTSGEASIKLVSLEKGGVSSVHSFKNLVNKLTSDNIDLDCIYREGVSKVAGDPRPELRIFDKNSGKNLIFIRYSSTEDETKIWNTIEMRELLKELTTINYQKQTPNTSPVSVSQQTSTEVPSEQPPQ